MAMTTNLSSISSKEIRKLVKKLSKQDWQIEVGAHVKCYSPDKVSVIVISKSPRCQNLRKTESELRKVGAIL
jgi:hypothetical protein